MEVCNNCGKGFDESNLAGRESAGTKLLKHQRFCRDSRDKEKYIDDEFAKWRKMPCYNPFGLDVDDDWRCKSFALHILKSASFTRKVTK
jgi:hypothetical protein